MHHIKLFLMKIRMLLLHFLNSQLTFKAPPYIVHYLTFYQNSNFIGHRSEIQINI